LLAKEWTSGTGWNWNSLKKTPGEEAQDPDSILPGCIAQDFDILIEVLLAILVVNDLLERHVLFKLDGETTLVDDDGDVTLFAICVPDMDQELAETPWNYKPTATLVTDRKKARRWH